MKITKSQLKQAIKEEISKPLEEGIGTGMLIGGMLMAMATLLLGKKPKDEEQAKAELNKITDEERRELAKQVAQQAMKKIEDNMSHEEFADAGMPDTKPQTDLGWDPSSLGETKEVKITKSRLQQIILEEYIKEEALEEALSAQQEKEMLAWIRKQGPKPDWLGDNYGHSKKGAHAPVDPNVDRSAETMPIPSDDAPESEYSGFQDRAGPSDETYPGPWPGDGPQEKNVQDRVISLVQEMPPEEMLDLFTSVIEKLAPEYIEPSRPPIGFREVKEILNDVLRETGDYHFGFGDEEKYDVMKGEGPPEEAPFHDMYDDHVPYARELAQKMWDGGERLPDTSQTAQLSAKQEASLIDTIEKESGDLHVDKDALSDLVMDVTEELWAIQEKSEDA